MLQSLIRLINKRSTVDTKIRNFNDISHSLSFMFTWSGTPEGHDFWNKIEKLARRGNIDEMLAVYKEKYNIISIDSL